MPALSPPRPDHPPRTPLTELGGWLGARLRSTQGDPDGTVVTGLTLSSRRVQPGDLYAALPGARAHGATFADAAVAAGAVALITDSDGVGLLSEATARALPVLVVDRPRALLGDLASRIYGHPSRALRLVGVTGTQGKTTVTRLLEQAVQVSGTPAAVIGTVGTRIAGRDVPSELTTPEAPDLHALFAVMRERGVDTCAMEVSSHALVMGRVDGVVFDVACFTNLGRDHLDFHADVEEYFAAKASLFTPERTRLGLTNLDDAHGRRLLEEATVPMRGFSTAGMDADWGVEEVESLPTRSTFTAVGPNGQRVPGGVPLPGGFNVSNALCAVAAAAEAGLDPSPIAVALAAGDGVPGRLEQVDAGQGFLAVVDYAHKPDAVAAALATLRPLTRGRLILVIGAGGERDPGKRPIMGEIAARLCDVLVVTDDNPRGEDPAVIRAQLVQGTCRVPEPNRAEVLEVGDRADAIARAVGLAVADDTVLVAGKGHETGQEVAGEMLPFDDREVLRRRLRTAP